MENKELARKAIAGEEEAFLAIMHAYKIDLYKTAFAYLHNEEESLEAIQEVTYRAYKSIKKVKKPAYIKTWLLRIMINYCNDVLKRKKKMIMNEAIIPLIATMDNYQTMEIQEAIETLDERSREIITLKYYHDLKIKEIAFMLDCPEGTVKTWLNKALKQLKNKLDGKGGSRHVQ
ncbi:sigma-70 family RNA polymerase sigma factor [Niallia sp. NCCP-28]|uniref:sigma-70 family RNA polymerase sigma factor n=1 Tax=Niallia sp. NCCP-28 TaxID=2934712 RepID=UPI0020884090|nr:sigma-70 family RNA polymerase sigma factor [Niallia sp. NCCP-28]GKU83774.1 DNA-directed RNA polymerase sigma-70 factor [Niallia sp. NCCP-28]